MLERCVSPTVGRRRWGAYFVCGVIGWLAGLTLVTVLATAAGLDGRSRAILALTPPVTLLLTIRATPRIFGQERIVFYEQALATIGATALVAWVAGAPVATTIDLATIGVGTFLACGRVGCFKVACCHGRPARRGVAYRHVHAGAGFPARWVGVRLLPVQLIDAAVSVTMVGAATAWWLAGAPAGAAACLYAGGYGAARFGLELLRGDTLRPRLAGATEAQWTAALTTAAAALWRPAWWSIAAAATIGLALAGLVIARRRGAIDRLWLASAWHVDEVAGLLGGLVLRPGSSATTGEGVRLSAARLPDGRVDLIVSRPGRAPSEAAIRGLAARLGRPWRGWSVVAARTPGLVHVILDDRPEADEGAAGAG